jgi:hypothetical protein
VQNDFLVLTQVCCRGGYIASRTSTSNGVSRFSCTCSGSNFAISTSSYEGEAYKGEEEGYGASNAVTSSYDEDEYRGEDSVERDYEDTSSSYGGYVSACVEDCERCCTCPGWWVATLDATNSNSMSTLKSGASLAFGIIIVIIVLAIACVGGCGACESFPPPPRHKHTFNFLRLLAYGRSRLCPSPPLPVNTCDIMPYH